MNKIILYSTLFTLQFLFITILYFWGDHSGGSFGRVLALHAGGRGSIAVCDISKSLKQAVTTPLPHARQRMSRKFRYDHINGFPVSQYTR